MDAWCTIKSYCCSWRTQCIFVVGVIIISPTPWIWWWNKAMYLTIQRQFRYNNRIDNDVPHNIVINWHSGMKPLVESSDATPWFEMVTHTPILGVGIKFLIFRWGREFELVTVSVKFRILWGLRMNDIIDKIRTSDKIEITCGFHRDKKLWSFIQVWFEIPDDLKIMKTSSYSTLQNFSIQKINFESATAFCSRRRLQKRRWCKIMRAFC